jgi:hypothetical protein
MSHTDGRWPWTVAPGDEPGRLEFFGSPEAELFTRELDESLEGVLTHNLYPAGSVEPGFASASAPGRVCEGQCWTRDAGTLLRELVQWGYLGQASMEAQALIRLVRPNAAGFLVLQQAVGRRNLKFNLDTANQFCQKENLVLSLARLSKDIRYIHVSDNHGERPEHLEIGRGKIPWREFFSEVKRMGYKGRFGIDIECPGGRNAEAIYMRNARKLEALIQG